MATKLGGAYDELVQRYLQDMMQLQTEQKRQVAPELARAGILTSPYGQQRYLDIEKQIQRVYGTKTAEMGLQRAREETELGKWQQQFGLQQQQLAQELKMFEDQYRLYREALRRQQEDWWKPVLGAALGTGLGVVTGGLGSKWLGLGKA